MKNKAILALLLFCTFLSIPNATAATAALTIGLAYAQPWWAADASVYLDGRFVGKTDSHGFIYISNIIPGSHFINAQATYKGSKYVGQKPFDVKRANEELRFTMLLNRVGGNPF
jgi:hypothetical protein